MSRAVGPGPRKALEAPGPKALEPIGSEPKARYMRPVGPLSTNAGSILSSVRRWCYDASVSVAQSLLRTAWQGRVSSRIASYARIIAILAAGTR